MMWCERPPCSVRSQWLPARQLTVSAIKLTFILEGSACASGGNAVVS